MALLNLAGMTTATTGTGTVTLGSAMTGLQTFATAGAVSGARYSYRIDDGSAWELGTGIYTTSGTTLTRRLVASSTGSLLSLSGSATVRITAQVADIGPLDNMSATSAPTTGDDAADGYQVGSKWLWDARGQEWVCIDATVSAARWGVSRHHLSAFNMTVARINAHYDNQQEFGGYTKREGAYTTGPQPTDRPYTNRTTCAAATVNFRAAYGIELSPYGDNTFMVPASGNPRLPRRACHIVFNCPDTSYGTTSTGARVCAGIFAGTGWDSIVQDFNGINSTSTNAIGMWIRYDTSVSDVNWQLLIRETSATSSVTTIDTGVPFVSAMTDVWNASFIIEGPGVVRFVLFRPDTDTYYSRLITTGLPTGIGLVTAGVALKTLDNVARGVGFSSVAIIGEPNV